MAYHIILTTERYLNTLRPRRNGRHFASFAFTIVFLHHIYSGDNWLRWSLAWISLLPMGLSPSYLFWWQLMWCVTTDVAVSVCGLSGLWPFRSVAVPVCGPFGLWPFQSVAFPLVAISIYAVSVCGRFRCGRFGLWPLWPVTVDNCVPANQV